MVDHLFEEQGSKKYIVTCGNFNVAPVCLSAKNESSIYIPCVDTIINSACLNSGAIQSCNGNIFLSKGIKGHPISTRNVSRKVKLPQEITDFKQDKKVYDREMKVIESIMEDREILCLKKGHINKYSLCFEEATLDFACLNAAYGTIVSCQLFKAVGLGVPLCVTKNLEVTTCGKFARSPMCLYKVSDDTLLAGCSEERGEQACLSESGTLEPCGSIGNRNNVNKSGNYDYENEKEAVKNEILRMINDSHQQKSILCIRDENTYKLVNCDEDPFLNFACLGAVKRYIGKCNPSVNDVPIAVCAMVPSNYFVTCDLASHIHLCLSKGIVATNTFPCDKPDQYTCVTENGYLGKCDEQKEVVPMKVNNDLEEENSADKRSLQYLVNPTVVTRGPNERTEEEEYEEANTDYSSSKLYPIVVTVPVDESKESPTTASIPSSVATNEKFFRVYCTNCSIEHRFVIVGTPDDVLPEVEVITFPEEE